MRLYQNLFSYIVSKVNSSLCHSGNKFIGILDIFGFESFEINRYEQLCINYTNEQLQQQFNKYIFKLEQIEYEKEGIDWTHITFPDNQECLDLLAGKLGLIDMLDEENRIPNGNSKNFTERFLRKYSGNKYVTGNKKFKDLFLYNSMKTTIEKTNTILIIPVRLLVKTNDVRGMIEIRYQALDFLAK